MMNQASHTNPEAQIPHTRCQDIIFDTSLGRKRVADNIRQMSDTMYQVQSKPVKTAKVQLESASVSIPPQTVVV